VRPLLSTTALALALAALLGANALAAAPQVEVSDIEDEVMCPICGTLLELADSPQARREKLLVKRLIAEGRSKQEIKDELVAEYGEVVLAVPEGSGFNLTAFLVPVLALALALVALVVGVRRWRRDGDRGDPPSDAPPAAEDTARLDADISRYDL
jgi:cytochrome c-type biogenesis protein CcmH